MTTDTDAIAKALGAWPTGNLCNADERVGAMASRLRPLYAGIRLFGPARTVRISAGQNAAIHRAVHAAGPGEVLVVDGGASRAFGPFGDILATCCRNRGLAGLVIDGTVRDTAELKAMAFPVFCLGAHPAATAKTDPGETDITIECGGVAVSPGDIIVGDDDGVVVVPAAIAVEVADKVRAVGAREKEIMDELAAGRTTAEIFGLAAD